MQAPRPVAPPTTNGSAPRWWQREWFRQTVPTPPAAFALLLPADIVVRILAAWNIYAAGYLVLTWLTFRRRTLTELRALATSSTRGRFTDRLASPPDQLPQSAATMALLAAAFVLPQFRTIGGNPVLVMAIGVLAVLGCWLTIQAGFAVAYINLYFQRGGLRFPDDAGPSGLVDFLYFTVAVSTSFGAADVTVTTPEMRRKVLAHSVFAFVFNTLILAATVSVIASIAVSAS
ncbi:DUF1345 domain-containing protein [Pseudonocardia sp. NPDC049635]|uniref:DUF1345 domain-containing protein n=1 Tax=Pseudonocardia sp. NPDC049635 TaxID=3155506 RepID=UPI00341176A5